jgi:hypothetical protein
MVEICFRNIKGVKTATSKATGGEKEIPFFISSIAQTIKKKKNKK